MLVGSGLQIEIVVCLFTSDFAKVSNKVSPSSAPKTLCTSAKGEPFPLSITDVCTLCSNSNHRLPQHAGFALHKDRQADRPAPLSSSPGIFPHSVMVQRCGVWEQIELQWFETQKWQDHDAQWVIRDCEDGETDTLQGAQADRVYFLVGSLVRDCSWVLVLVTAV